MGSMTLLQTIMWHWSSLSQLTRLSDTLSKFVGSSLIINLSKFSTDVMFAEQRFKMKMSVGMAASSKILSFNFKYSVTCKMVPARQVLSSRTSVLSKLSISLNQIRLCSRNTVYVMEHFNIQVARITFSIEKFLVYSGSSSSGHRWYSTANHLQKLAHKLNVEACTQKRLLVLVSCCKRKRRKSS